MRRVAVLLAGGVPASAAWAHVGRDVPTRVVAGAPGRADASGDRAWTAVAAAWSVAVDVGAPLAATLARLADGLDELSRSRREVEIALSGPIATTRLVVALPLLGLVAGLLIGVDTAGVLLGRPLGWACLVAGAVLLLVGRAWSRRLVRAATPSEELPGLDADLTAIALAGGVPLERSRALAAAELAAMSSGPDPEVDELLELGRRTGAPAAGLLAAAADGARRRAATVARTRAARLDVTLMIPLGVCVLPAFICLGVIPLIAAVLDSSVTGL